MKKMNLCLALSFAVLASCPVLAQAKAKPAVCQIDGGGQTRYKGKCLFTPEQGGSFTLQHPQKNKALMNGISMVSVSIIEKDFAEVRGLTKEGINSRWGEAHRSQQQKACWVGSDFKICAW